ncbi:hypothetical protein AMATHDRAFT_147847 [Amanita thiersii Skay4041]|uniref:Nuclear condensin complex subunit 3 C-terminal domain-containing protein n=1 Tax=Amanita thiersii Skay4041 TaxID=703135 RepID=A0A2A9NGY1_9AGAR|nr:hypothetical protein AMATHDRAFT_147847 [Amanita thiersii Skay4041]
MPGRAALQEQKPILQELETAVPRIFDQAQVSTANHQKNFVALYKLHTEAAQHTETVKNGRGVKLVGERKIEEIFTLMLLRILPLKKGTSPADRIVKFVGGYVKFLNDKAAEEKNLVENPDEDEDEDTTASRFTARLLTFLLKGFVSKEKSVRYRVLSTVAEMVSHLGAIDEEIYMDLRTALLDRMTDKETSVRVQVVIALAKLAGSEDPSEITEGELLVLDVLIDSLTHDPSPEVRRAALLNMPLNEFTIPHILDRTRDTDVPMRKLVYSAILERNTTLDDEDHKDAQKGSSMHIGPTHPRVLKIAQREIIVRNGLGDRDPSVRAAAEALLGTWIDVNIRVQSQKENKALEKAVTFLNLFDLSENDVASDALLSVFSSRPEIYDGLDFEDPYWTLLSPEKAFLARVFVDHCCATKNTARLEATLPVVTALAFRIQEAYNDLGERMRVLDEERLFRRAEGIFSHKLIDGTIDLAREDDETVEREYMIGEMLKLAVNLDYSDEIGRRKMFQLMRDMLSQEALPEKLLTKCLDVLRELSASERDLIRVVVEIIQDLRDPGDEEEDIAKEADAETSFAETPATARVARAPVFNRTKKPEEFSPEEKARKDQIDLRCLSLCTGMLTRVNGKLEDNSTLRGILHDLIIPSVQRKELVFREKGIVCLGLCCLIDRTLALSSFMLFFNQTIVDIPEDLKMNILEVVFDMLMVHEHDFVQKHPDISQKVTERLVDRLVEEENSKVKALLCIGISKLVLCGMITDTNAIRKLIVTYLSPDTADNQQLRQCLTFFFPVYCYSSESNQQCMREIFMETFIELNDLRRRIDDDQDMLSATQVANLFVDWTDPVRLAQAIGKGKGPAADDTIQLDLAGDIIKGLLDKKHSFEKEDKRVLTQTLSKLYVPDTIDDDKIRTLKLLIHSLQTRRPLRDATSNNALRKFDSTISKKFEKQLEDFSEEHYRKLEELKALFEFLDDIIPEDDDETETEAKRKGRKRLVAFVVHLSDTRLIDFDNRRSDSVVTSSSDSSRSATPTGFAKDGKKRRISSPIEDDSEEESEVLDLTPPPEEPTRTLPKRQVTAKKPKLAVIALSDSEEEVPLPKKPKRAR